jgi:hypothetical protein
MAGVRERKRGMVSGVVDLHRDEYKSAEQNSFSAQRDSSDRGSSRHSCSMDRLPYYTEGM